MKVVQTHGIRARNARRSKSGRGAPRGSAGRFCIKNSGEGFPGRLLPMRWFQMAGKHKTTKGVGPARGLAGGPDAKERRIV